MKVLFLFFTLISFITTQLNAVECELRCETNEVATTSKSNKRVGHECCDDLPGEEKKENQKEKNPCNDHPNQFINSCYHNYVSDYKKSNELGSYTSSYFSLTPLYLSSIWYPHFFSEIKPKVPIDNISFLRMKSQLRLYIQNKQLLN